MTPRPGTLRNTAASSPTIINDALSLQPARAFKTAFDQRVEMISDAASAFQKTCFTYTIVDAYAAGLPKSPATMLAAAAESRPLVGSSQRSTFLQLQVYT